MIMIIIVNHVLIISYMTTLNIVSRWSKIEIAGFYFEMILRLVCNYCVTFSWILCF